MIFQVSHIIISEVQSIQNFVFLDVIGRGGFGKVYNIMIHMIGMEGQEEEE